MSYPLMHLRRRGLDFHKSNGLVLDHCLADLAYSPNIVIGSHESAELFGQ